VTSDDLLARLGLEARKTPIDYLLPALGIFGTGLLVGAGVALLLTPKTGSDMRADIGRSAARLKGKVLRRGNGTPDLHQMTRDELYERASEFDIEGRSQMSKAELIDALGAT
jgi:gas vesicle protein